MNDNDKANYHVLVAALQLVAMPYQKQVDAFPAFVSPPDEVAVIFGDSYLAAAHIVSEMSVSPYVNQALADLNVRLDEMSRNKELWTLDALKESYEWSQCRSLAEQVLIGLKEPLEAPNLDFIKFIK